MNCRRAVTPAPPGAVGAPVHDRAVLPARRQPPSQPRQSIGEANSRLGPQGIVVLAQLMSSSRRSHNSLPCTVTTAPVLASLPSSLHLAGNTLAPFTAPRTPQKPAHQHQNCLRLAHSFVLRCTVTPRHAQLWAQQPAPPAAVDGPSWVWVAAAAPPRYTNLNKKEHTPAPAPAATQPLPQWTTQGRPCLTTDGV